MREWRDRLDAGLVLDKLKDEPVEAPSGIHESDLSLQSELDELLDEIASSSERECSARSDSDAIFSVEKVELKTLAEQNGNQQDGNQRHGNQQDGHAIGRDKEANEKKVVEAGDKIGGAREVAALETEGTNGPSCVVPKTDVQKADVPKTDVQKDELPFAAEDSPKVAADDPALQAFLKGLM